MIEIAAQMRVPVAVEPADFRCGIDGMVKLCRERLGADPFCGAVYVFYNRRRTAVKMGKRLGGVTNNCLHTTPRSI